MVTQITRSEDPTHLAERIDALEMRVACLEQSKLRPTSNIEPVADIQAIRPNQPAVQAESSQMSGVLTVVGKALLGIAGAYVLRALSGSGIVPRALVAALAATYALGWLVAAARTVSRQRWAGVLYAITSILIFAPMLWEMTLRFRVMPPLAAAGVLAAYACAATVLSYRAECSPVFSTAHAGCALTALALAVGTHDMTPFSAILLTMLAVCNFSSVSSRVAASRIVVAIAADLSVWSLLFTYRTPAETRADYPSLSLWILLAAPLLLFAIQAATVAIHTGFAACSITVFEVFQSMVTLLLAACGIAWFLPGPSQIFLGAFYLSLSSICYGAAFARFRHLAEQRNVRVFTLWAGALLIGGFYLSAPSAPASAWPPASVWLGAAAVAAMLLSRGLQSAALAIHAVSFVVLGAAFSGLLQFSARAVAGGMPSTPPWPVFAMAVCALLLFAASRESDGEPWPNQFLNLIPALLAAFVVTAFLTLAAVDLAALVLTPDVFHIALIRTLALCFIAMGLAFGGARLGREQTIRVAYAAMYFVAAKLLFEDLRHGRMEFIAGSICLVAVTFIAVPRLAKHRRAS
jgi:hypothetical protein